MPLSHWAARLSEIDPKSVPVETLGFHLADTIAALRAGSATREGKALARLYGVRTWKFSGLAEVAAMAGTIRLTEIDDIHLETCITPSAVVVPVALTMAAIKNASPEMLTRGLIAGYATMLRHGRQIGGAAALAKGIWPTLVAAPMGAAATAAVMLGLPIERTATALRLALLRSMDRVGQSPGALPARWYIFGEAVADGMKAAFAAAEGFVADQALDRQLLAEGALEQFGLPVDPTEIDTISQKPFCTSRQAAGGTVVFRRLMTAHQLDPSRITGVDVDVPAAYHAMVSRPLQATNRLSTLTSQGFQIAAAALSPRLLNDIERAGPFPGPVIDFVSRVRVAATGDFDADFPRRWPARVTVTMDDGRKLAGMSKDIEGDPGAKLSLENIREKSATTPMVTLQSAAEAVKDSGALRHLIQRLAA